MVISKKETKKVAELSRIDLSKAEIDKFSNQLSSVLDDFAKLQKLDTKNIKPTSQVTGLTNIARKDRKDDKWKVDKDPKKNREKLLENAPPKAKLDGFIKVPAVFGNSEEA